MRSTGSGKKNGDGESSRKQTKKCCGAADDGGNGKSDDAATPKKRNRKELSASSDGDGSYWRCKQATLSRAPERKNERESAGIRVERGVALPD
ncbi:hypothetical protein MTO96_023527 [Rhipicephalus appendiculatus]